MYIHVLFLNDARSGYQTQNNGAVQLVVRRLWPCLSQGAQRWLLKRAVRIFMQGGLWVLIEAYGRNADAASSSGGAAGPVAERRLKVKSSIKVLIRGCTASAALEVFVAAKTAPELLIHLLRRLLPLLQDEPKARQQYVTNGGLMRMQQLEAVIGTKGAGEFAAVNTLFPDDVVDYYRQGGK